MENLAFISCFTHISFILNNKLGGVNITHFTVAKTEVPGELMGHLVNPGDSLDWNLDQPDSKVLNPFAISCYLLGVKFLLTT